MTRTLKDSPVDLAICLKARTKLKGILTVKTTLRSGIGCIRPTFWASRIYRNACLLETRYRPIKAVTVFVLERSLPKRSSAPLMRWASCVPEDLISGHRCTTFYVTQSTIIPSSLVGDHPFKLKVCDCVGGVISPVLSNIFLHYVLDEWMEQVVKPRLRGKAFLIRYADDFVMGFTHEQDARRVLAVLPQRLGKYGLAIHPDKTRLIAFQEPAKAAYKKDMGSGPAGTFTFLGFTHYWGRSPRGRWVVKRKTASSRLSRALQSIALWCRANRHLPVKEQQQILTQKLRGHFAYYGITGNFRSLAWFRFEVVRCWRKWLNRRNRERSLDWNIFNRLLERYPLPPARVVHSVYYRAASP